MKRDFVYYRSSGTLALCLYLGVDIIGGYGSDIVKNEKGEKEAAGR